MIRFTLDPDASLLIVHPEGRLEKSDFEMLAQEIDPYIESHGKLHGLMIDAQTFPGWDSFGSMLTHLKFVRDHHRQIEKIAAVSDSRFLTIAPRLADHFVRAEVRHFKQANRDEALQWLLA